ncbi:gamma-glutamyltransferase family protein [Ornithinimicrobium faecis]|uniref:Gamma-glutamyltransferase family protein n=1 Tax=Ornithinimicrobium faecis TaxID=2934158 RepID=A0ABY4YY50_9MICO|nr:gamma-glutamyltransferase [Ornithinimicrobium sp. HY1793]USQ81273.1 gamma-glutamyltransferase family protein [Ornithinimicrobium sp. HY1793]
MGQHESSFVLAEGSGRVGDKGRATSQRAVASSQHPTVTEAMLDVLAAGGTAADAVVAGSIVQAVVQQDMTNHTGTVTGLFYSAETDEISELNSMGRIVPGLAAHHPVPGGKGLYSAAGSRGPMSVIPGFMPGMKAIHERFGTKDWGALVAPAAAAAREGHVVSSFEHLVMAQTVDLFLYTQSGREHFTAGGHLPQAGEVWAQPVLADTMEALAAEGPDHFITGEWAQHFVARAAQVGWSIELDHLNWTPRWSDPATWTLGDFEVSQLSAPDRQAVYCAIVIGILDALDVTSLGHFTESPRAGYYMAHALRLAHLECGFINDPAIFEDPSSTLMDPEFHAFLANKLRRSLPKIDLTEHIELTRGKTALFAAGGASKQPAGSCELSVIDEHGNWAQMMNTLQSGGIPGEVVDGVPMVGSHQINALTSPISGWLTGGGGMRSILSNTMVRRDGEVIMALGSPGNVHCTVPQVLANVLLYGDDPHGAEERPRMLPLADDYVLSVESRVSPDYVRDLAQLGVLVNPLPAYDYHMGSYQACWRGTDSTLHASTGPRREGAAGGLS